MPPAGITGGQQSPATSQGAWRVVRATCRLLARLLIHSSARKLLDIPGLEVALRVLLVSHCPTDVRDLVDVCLRRLEGQVVEVDSRGQTVDHAIPTSLFQDITAEGEPERQEAAVLALERATNQGFNISAFANDGGIAPLVSLLERGTPRAKEAATHVLHNLATSEDVQSRILGAGALPLLARIGRLGLPGWEDANKLLRTLS